MAAERIGSRTGLTLGFVLLIIACSLGGRLAYKTLFPRPDAPAATHTDKPS